MPSCTQSVDVRTGSYPDAFIGVEELLDSAEADQRSRRWRRSVAGPTIPHGCGGGGFNAPGRRTQISWCAGG